MLRFRAFQVIIHIAGWLLFMAFPLLFINGEQNGNLLALLSAPYYWLFCLTYIALFYLNGYLLVPALFLKGKHILYSVILIMLLTGVYFLQPFDRLLHTTDNNRNFMQMQVRQPMNDMPPDHGMGPPPGNYPDDGGPGGPPDHSRQPDSPPHFGPGPQPPMRRHHVDTTSIFIFIMIVALSSAIKITQQWQATEQRAMQAEADKTSAELSFLKAQINPHFLFNTLNNIYTLAVMKDEHAPDSIMKLSNIMRYVTDEATGSFVPLQSEIDCINDYIELQRLRLGEKTHISMLVSGDMEDKQIAPLILMTFIENVFKYGISKHHESAIFIKVSGDDKGINFFCQNSIFPQKDENQRTGIGLKNTRKRLAYLYPGKNELDINTDNHLFTVNLTLHTG